MKSGMPPSLMGCRQMWWLLSQVAVLCFLRCECAHVGEHLHLRASALPRADRTSLTHNDDHDQGANSKPLASARLLLLDTTSRIKHKLHEYLHPLSGAAVITTVALQMSPLPSTLEIKGDRHVKRYDGYPYFSVLAGATQWCLYGSFAAFMLHDMTLLTMVAANGPGVVLGVFYVTTYLRFVPAGDARSTALKRYLSFGCALLAIEISGCVAYGRSAVFWLGLLGAIGSAQIALSPFKTLQEVLHTRSTRSWPVDLCLWNLIQSAATGGFGLANNDAWVWAPNAIGVIAAVIQLTLIAAFREGSTSSAGAVKLAKPSLAYQS